MSTINIYRLLCTVIQVHVVKEEKLCCTLGKTFRSSAFHVEIIFHSHANKSHFHNKGCAPCLILKVRVFGTSEVAYSTLPQIFRKCFPKVRDKFLVPFCGEVRIVFNCVVLRVFTSLREDESTLHGWVLRN